MFAQSHPIPEMIDLIRLILERRGFRVQGAEGGRAGLEAVIASPPDLVLLDVNMPVMGGTQAFAELRAINPSCRVIIVTGYGRDTVETSSFPGRIDAFMQKPFQQETLAHNVRRVLDGG